MVGTCRWLGNLVQITQNYPHNDAGVPHYKSYINILYLVQLTCTLNCQYLSECLPFVPNVLFFLHDVPAIILHVSAMIMNS